MPASTNHTRREREWPNKRGAGGKKDRNVAGKTRKNENEVTADAFKYLVISPIYSYSHVKFMSNIADKLADHGHEVVVFQQQILESLREKKVIKNPSVKIINYEADEAGKEFYKARPKSTVSKYWKTNQAATPWAADQFAETMSKDLEHMCLQVFRDENLHDQLRSQNFDVVIAEPFDPCGLYLADYLKIPSTIVAMASSRIDPVQWAVGQPSGLNFIPGPGSTYGKESRIWDRVNNVWMFFTRTRMFRTVYWSLLDRLREKTGYPIRDIDEIVVNSAFLFFNSNPYLDFPFPSLTKCVPIGGFSMNVSSWKTEKLPENLDKLLDERRKTAYISFGSVIRSSDMPEDYKDGIVNMMKSMPDVTFIWKYEDEDDTEIRKKLPGNAHLIKWLPQPALLADPRLSLFITHGGLGSIMEVAYSGIPAIVVPLFFDQPMNGEMLKRHGGSEVYSKFDLGDSQKLKNVIRKMLAPEFSMNAKRLSNLLQKQPIDPVDRLIKHAEFAAEFKRLPELDPYSRQLNFIEYFYLDVVMIVVLILLAAKFLIGRLLCTTIPKSKQE